MDKKYTEVRLAPVGTIIAADMNNILVPYLPIVYDEVTNELLSQGWEVIKVIEHYSPVGDGESKIDKTEGQKKASTIIVLLLGKPM
jgi:hypothetical protein